MRPEKRFRPGSFAAGSVVLILAMFDCSSAEEPATDERVSTVLGSATAPLSDFPAVVKIGGCSGTVIGPNHVLTAGHCVTRNYPQNIGNIVVSGSGVNQTTTATQIFPNLEQDAAIVVTAAKLQAEPLRVYPGTMGPSWVGRPILTVGWANVNEDYSQRRAGWATIASVTARQFTYGSGTTAYNCQGDSGGPALASLNGRWYIIGIHSIGATQPACIASTVTDTRADAVASWIRSIVPMRGDNSPPRRSTNDAVASGDVNADGKQDFIVTTPTSTRLFLANSTGTGFTQPWTGPTGWTLGDIETVLGDFDGDGFADLAALTQTSLKVYRSTGNGFDLNAPFYQGPGWQIGYTSIYAGNFDGDARMDLLLMDTNAAEIYRSDGTAFVQGFFDLSRRVYNALPTLGDFNGDGKTDVIFQTDNEFKFFEGQSSAPYLAGTGVSLIGLGRGRGEVHLAAGRFVSATGSDLMMVGGPGFGTHLYRYQGGSPPGQFIDTWANTGLLANYETLTIGNFGGTGTYDDVLFTDDSGTFLYLATGNTSAAFTGNVWVRNDLNTRNTQYVSSDWSGDGLSDLWIITPGGSFGYKGQSSGAFQWNVWSDTTLKLQAFTVQ